MKRINAVQIYPQHRQPEFGYWRHLAELEHDAPGPGQGGSADNSAWQPGVATEDQQADAAPRLSRRRMLQLLGASAALAGASGCEPAPKEWLVPKVRRNTPGQSSRHFASVATVAGYAHGIVIHNRDGRPIKVEGNPDHPATLGACDAVAQASVLSLYDPGRSASPRHNGEKVERRQVLAELGHRRQRWEETGGAGLAFVTGAITSPSEAAALAALRKRWPRARWIVHEPLDRSAVYGASEKVLGLPLEPVFDFNKARCVLSLDGDVLQSQPGFVRYARDLSVRRQLNNRDIPLRLYALESTPGLFGAAADHRLALSPIDIELAARQLARGLGLPVAAPSRAVLPKEWLDALLAALHSAGPEALVIAGDQQSLATQMLVRLINHHLGASGHTVSYIPPVAAAAGDDDLAGLVRAIDRGEVREALVLNSNPVFSAAADVDFARAYRQLDWRCHFGQYRDETGRASHWHVPARHAMESWADQSAFDGSVALLQPVVMPLHDSWTALQMLAAVAGEDHRDARQLLRRYWQQRYRQRRNSDAEAENGDEPDSAFRGFWQRALAVGVVADSAPPQQVPVALAQWQLPPEPLQQDGLWLQWRPDPAVGDGREANNAWLQELPRPITTLSWQNALLVSPGLARQRGWKTGSVVAVTTPYGKLEMPVLPLPGQAGNTVTLHLGQGHTGLGQVADNCGHNGFSLRGHNAPWLAPVDLADTGRHETLALGQQHHDIEGRDLIRAATLEEYRARPDFAHHEDESSLPSLYPEPEPLQRSGGEAPAWAMTIDLSACIGCNACVTACQAENNIPVVGQAEVARGHDMHWIRVDRYFSGHPDNPGMVFQPVPCMHCENAPCEYVCPVGATQHSAEGLNQMVYQRCIGTRYCSQNCPYKVRRFNWFDYNSVDAAYPPAPARQNPEVTVRSRGVMEKCSYCVQRIQNGGQRAEAEGRALRDGEIETACQQACPTRAIVFGDRNRVDSEVSRNKASPRNYDMLGHLNVRPRTSYLAAVSNPDPRLAAGSSGKGEKS